MLLPIFFVFSRNNFAIEDLLGFMKKLNNKQVRYIIKQVEKGEPTAKFSTIYNVSQRRIQQLYDQYERTDIVPVLKACGRKKKAISQEIIGLILAEHNVQPCNAVLLQNIIQSKHKLRVPHNTIHMVLKGQGLAKDEPKKQKQRKWVRFERKHSLSLVQIDWHESKVIQGKQLITYLDDASRKILAAGEYDNATTENSIKTLDQAAENVAEYGGIECILSGNDSQFLVEFNKTLDRYGIGHIYSRVNHPQTVGKLERFHQTYEQHRGRFATLEEFVQWYNDVRVHMSLNMRHAETPSKAFIRKMHPEVWFSVWEKWFNW